MKRILIALLLGLASTACGDDDDDTGADGDADADADGDADACPVERLQEAALDAMEATLSPGLTLAVEQDEGCNVALAVGMADLEAELELQPGDVMRVGSITKTFTAAVILQLVEEGVLSLDDTIDRWWPSFPNADRITLRHLLAHTSGVFNYSEDADVIEGFGTEGGLWSTSITPEEIIAIAAENDPYGEPGTVFHYSNTNFIMAGVVIEDATGMTYGRAVRERLLDPFGLSSTFVEGEEEVPGLIQGYVYQHTTRIDPDTGATIRETELVEDVEFDISWAWSAGAVASTSADLVRWVRLLYSTDEVLSAESRAEMMTPVEVPDGGPSYYGLATLVLDTGYGMSYGHNGLVNGFNAIVSFVPDHVIAVASIANAYDAPGGSGRAVDNTLFELLEPAD